MAKNVKGKGLGSGVILAFIWVLWIALMYYLLLPAVNIHSFGMWMFIVFIGIVPAVILMAIHDMATQKVQGVFQPKLKDRTGIVFCIGIGILAIMMVLLLYGSKMFHAGRYSAILTAEDTDFTKDIDQANAVTKIALMDTDSAILLGNREIGSLSEVVSQYNVSEEYTQIDLNGSPVKVSALNYAGFFKYMGNKANGIPGYVRVDPVGQNAEYVALEKGMYYVPSSHFSKDLKRCMRMAYPTKVFGNIHFEVDEEGNPYYVASVYDYTIGVFGGETVQGAIICNPIDGSCEYLAVADIPTWVDGVFPGDLLVEQYNWNGTLSNGFINSIFGKKGCRKCTETLHVDSDEEDDEEESYAPDYGYVSKDGDIWIYTGVTSVNDDASNIGFILVNERTSEAHFYTIAGADESSAMSAAEGEVQEKGYQASFPSLVNVDNQPTYIMVLKDASGIVKLYAMVNVESYNKVTTSADIDECFAKYRKLIGTSTGDTDAEDSDSDNATADAEESAEELPVMEAEFTIANIQYVDIDGNTYVYLLGDDNKIYSQRFADNESLIYLQAGDTLKVQCSDLGNDRYALVSFEVTAAVGSSQQQAAPQDTESIEDTEQ